MKARWIAAFAVLAWQSVPLPAEASELQGAWTFREIIYQGERRPAPNPELHMTFEFRSDGTDRLYWTRDRGHTFCERTGKYEFSAGILQDEVTWVNPANARDCGRDPDMQEGNLTRTPVRREGNELQFSLNLGDEPLIYVWKAAPAN